MIEKLILDYLNEAIPAYMEMPEDYAPPFVVLEKTAGGGNGKLATATLAAQSYGTTLYDAASLNERVKARMEGTVALGEIAKVSLNSDYNFTDTEAKRYRYQAVFDIIYYNQEE